MDAKQLFFERYGGFQEYPALLLDGLNESQLRRSPHPALNPISWTLWHMARCEDVGVNRLLTAGTQVLEDGQWSARLRVSDRCIGTGMSKGEVERLCSEIDLTELTAYRSAVTERTEAVVGDLPSADLTQRLGEEMLRQVFVRECAGGSAAAELVEAYAGHTRGWLLGHIVLTHHFYHIGQATGLVAGGSARCGSLRLSGLAGTSARSRLACGGVGATPGVGWRPSPRRSRCCIRAGVVRHRVY